MADLTLPAPQKSRRGAFAWRSTLDGSRYSFRMVYHTRDQRWSLDLSDELGTPLLTGVRVVTETNLIATLWQSTAPAGQLFVRDDETAGRNPSRWDFHGAFRLVYRPAADVALAVGTADEVF